MHFIAHFQAGPSHSTRDSTTETQFTFHASLQVMHLLSSDVRIGVETVIIVIIVMIVQIIKITEE